MSISGDSFRRDSQPSVQEEGPSVEMYFSFREVWVGVREDIFGIVFEKNLMRNRDKKRKIKAESRYSYFSVC